MGALNFQLRPRQSPNNNTAQLTVSVLQTVYQPAPVGDSSKHALLSQANTYL